MAVASPCPDPASLQQLLLGRISDEAAETLERHLEYCDVCGRLLPTLETDDTLVDAMRARATIVLEAADLDTIQALLPRLRELRANVLSSGPSHTDVQGEGDSGRPNITRDALNFLNPPQSADEIGRLGPYRILKLLGQGGMGAVFLAEDSDLRRTVALKVMLPEAARKTSAKERFLREARVTATIEHDHIVTVFQVGEDRDVPFMAMQLLKGSSLQELLDQQDNLRAQPFVLNQVLRLGREIAQGLAAAHQRGLIHRDIKPANIWLDATTGDRVKILDFGLARIAEEDSLLTQFGTIVGSPAYMAPEQARTGGKIDTRADLFSLGCVLYRLCAGRVPWKGDDAMGTLLAVASEEPIPVDHANPELPPALAAFVMELLAKSPENRPRSAELVVERLQAIQGELSAVQLKMAMPLATQAAQTPARERSDSAGKAIVLPRTTIETPDRRRRRFLIGLGLLMAALSLATVFFVKTDAGTLQIQTLAGDVQVIVEQDGRQVEVVDTKTGASVRLHSGEYHLRLGDSRPNIQLGKDHIWITRGAVSVATITMAQKTDGALPANSMTPGAEMINSIGMKLCFIPAGTFIMGSPPDEASRNPDEHQHEVVLTRSFYMGAFCVTVGQFRQFIHEATYKPEGGDAWSALESEQADDFPVGNVSWNDAVAFCEWLTKKEGRHYRMPTEAEWEYACRAGSQTAYFFGDDPRHLLQYANAGGKSRPMGQLKPNPWGLHNMYGNQWQWTSDWYAADYYLKSPKKDPVGPVTGVARVMRGGSPFMFADICRSAYRHGNHEPSWHKPHVGFRVVLEMPPVTEPSR